MLNVDESSRMHFLGSNCSIKPAEVCLLSLGIGNENEATRVYSIVNQMSWVAL